MEEKRFLKADDVADYMGISVPMAYKIIRRLNEELHTSFQQHLAANITRL